jgi:ankyrin repeat protein
VRYLVKELGADDNQANEEGSTPLFIAASNGHVSVVKCFVNELGADIHWQRHDGGTLLMETSHNKHTDMVKWLVKAGAESRASSSWGTAAELSKDAGASIEHTAYLEAKTHCSNLGCSGAGVKKCTGCKQARYCGDP